MAKRNYEAYTFADAYIGCFVKNLMNWQDMTRLASCKDLKTAQTMLREFGYDETKALYDEDVEGFIRNEKRRLYARVYSALPEKKELALYLRPFDYHNVKVCLKAEFLGIAPPEDLLVSMGDMDWKGIVSMVRERNDMFMPSIMKEALSEAVDLFGRGGDPQEIDIIMDKACYRQMLHDAEAMEEAFLIDFVKLQIDIQNLKTFVRLRQMEKPWSFFQKVFLEGGSVRQQLFVSCYEENYGQAADKLAPYGLREVLSEGGRRLEERGDFTLLEKLCDDCVMEFNKKARYETFGIVPIAGYWYAGETELNNLRVILTGILIGSTPEQISEKLREPYV